LSVSVVPKSRAGMATGIFSTTRVAGEGIALATVSALLAALVQSGLHAAAPQAKPTAIVEAAARLATGDLERAAMQLPDIAHSTLRASYYAAFDHLLSGLTVVTMLCALMAFAFLGRVRAHEEPASAETSPRAPELACDDA
jgi:hypothetical protein